jgi:hypothetical protein
MKKEKGKPQKWWLAPKKKERGKRPPVAEWLRARKKITNYEFVGGGMPFLNPCTLNP